MPLVSIVIPCFNNERQLESTCNAIVNETLHLDSLALTLELILVDDASTDSTWEHIVGIKKQLTIPVKGFRLGQNFGAYQALIVGLKQASGDAVVVMAADGDDPPSELPNLISAWQTGLELVQAARISRSGSLVNKALGTIFYSLMKRNGVQNLPFTGCDFMLADKSIVNKALSFGFKPGNTLIQLYQHAENVLILTYTKGARPSHGWTILKKLDLFVFSFFTAIYPLKSRSVMSAIMQFPFALVLAINKPSAANLVFLSFSSLLMLWCVVFSLRYDQAMKTEIPRVTESV